jgi:hypothetical protein
MLVPENYGGEQTTSQWHARPDKNADGKLIEPYRMPPMSMGTRPNKTIGAVITHDRATDEITQRSDQTRRSLASKPFQTGVWMDYVMEIKFVHNGAGKGLVKIWRNGSLHHQYSGPIGFNDKAHEYFKFGIYKHDTAIKNHKRKTGVEWESSTMFFDDILIYEK